MVGKDVDGCALGELLGNLLGYLDGWIEGIIVIGAFEGLKEVDTPDGTEVGHPPSGSPTNAVASTIVVVSREDTQSRRMHKAKA